MRRFLLLFFMFQSCIVANAQMARWIMKPAYDTIYIASGAPLIIVNSAETSYLWNFEGVKLASTKDDIHPFREGYAVTTRKGTDIITGFFDTRGMFTKLKDYCNVAYSYPYFSNGYLLVKRGRIYTFINTNGTEQPFTSFIKAYPFNKGLATCFTYKSVEKFKGPYYWYTTINNTPVLFHYGGKVFNKEDVQFLSSLTDDGMGIAIIKQKVYWFDDNTGRLSPIFAKREETNIKRQVSVEGGIHEFAIHKNDTIIVQGKGGREDFISFVFDKMLKLIKINYADRSDDDFKEAIEPETQYTSAFSAIKGSDNKYGLAHKGAEVLPAQFERVGLLLNDFAVVRSNGKWGMLTYDTTLTYRLVMHEGKDIAFRHREVVTAIRLVLPSVISADKCRFDVGEQFGCVLDKISLETKNTENGNYVQYKCILTIPDSLPDVLTDIEYPVQITYDGLRYQTESIKARAWHHKYINVDVDEKETTIQQGDVSFTINITVDRLSGENDYPFEATIHTDSLKTDTVRKPEIFKISETRYKCNLYSLAEGVNNVNIRIVESGCPPYVFPFEITYIKPVEPSLDTPEVQEDVKIERKNTGSKPRPNIKTKTETAKEELVLPI